MAKLVSSASMIRILKQALHSNIEVYGLFVYIKIELCGSHRIAVLRNHYFPILFKSKELIMKFQEFTITVACMPNHWCQSGSLWLGFIWIWIFVRSYLLENPRDRYKCWYKSEQKMWDHNTEICMYVVVHVAISANWSTFQRWNILKLVTLADPAVIHLKWNEGTSKHLLQTWLLILSATVSF